MDRSRQLLQFMIDEEDFCDEVLATLLHSGLMRVEDYPRATKIPCRTHPFSGHELITDILSGHPNMGYDYF